MQKSGISLGGKSGHLAVGVASLISYPGCVKVSLSKTPSVSVCVCMGDWEASIVKRFG